MEIREILHRALAAIVDEPGAIHIEISSTRDNGVRFRVHVAPQDVGKIIGKGGRTARALRTIMQAAARKQHQTYTLDIADQPYSLRGDEADDDSCV